MKSRWSFQNVCGEAFATRGGALEVRKWLTAVPAPGASYTDLVVAAAVHALFIDGVAVRPATGAALVFAHGPQHQGAPVSSGTKYVLRSDVMFRG